MSVQRLAGERDVAIVRADAAVGHQVASAAAAAGARLAAIDGLLAHLAREASAKSELRFGDIIRDHGFGDDDLVEASFIKADGSSRAWKRGTLERATERPHFAAHRDDPSAALRVGRARIGQTSGKWIVMLSKRVDGDRGQFAGAVAVALDPDALAAILQGLELPAGAFSAFIGPDGFTRSHRIAERAFFDLDLGRTTLMAAARTRPSGSLVTDDVDGVKRHFSYRIVPGTTMVVAAGISEADIPGGAGATATWLVANIAASIVLAGAFAWWLARRRRAAIEPATAARVDASLHTAADRLASLVDALAKASGETEIFRSVGEFVRSFTPCNGIFISSYDDVSRMRKAVFAWSDGVEQDASSLPPQPITQDPHSRAVVTGEVIVTDDQASVVVPMKSFGKVIGAIEVQSPTRAAFQCEHVEILRMAAPLAAMALEHARLLQRKRALREATEEMHRRSKAVIDASLDAIVTVDHEDRILEFNPAAERIFGFAREKVIGACMADLLVPARYREQHLRGLKRLAGGGESFMLNQRLELPALRADGKEIAVELCIARIGQADRPTFTGFVRDIEARRLAEQALRQSEERFKAIAKAIADTVWDWDARTNQLWWGDGITNTFGYPPHELEPDLSSWTTRIHPDDRERVVNGIQKVVLGKESSWTDSYRFLRKDGTYAFVQDHGRVLRNPDGSASRMVGGMSDRTAFYEAQEAQKSLEQQLRQAQKMDAIGRLAGGVAHDFNNIVGAILANVELAEEEAGGSRELRLSLGEIRRASLRARDLTQQILSFSRRQAGARLLVDVRDVLADAMALLRPTLPGHVELRQAVDPSLVLGDRTLLGQIVINLVSNAAYAVRDRAQPRIELIVRPQGIGPEDPLVANGSLAPGEYVLLQVADNGCGMDSETMARVFEPFFTTKPMGEGTGLGLAVVHGIVTSHGGVVDLRSTPGSGSTFSVYLRRAYSEATQAVAEEGRPEMTSGRGEHILYVDDDDVLVSVVQRLLQKRGYRVTAFTDPHEALERLRHDARQFHVVLTDYNMPVMSGTRFAAEVRQLAGGLPLAIISGYINETLEAEAKEAGVDELLFKPRLVESLCDAVQRLIASRRSQSKAPAEFA